MEKILNGAKPGDLRIETVSRHELVINLKAAQEIGVSIPSEVLQAGGGNH